WIQRGQADIKAAMLGEHEVEKLGAALMGELARYTGASVGAFYRRDGEDLLRVGHFAASTEGMSQRLRRGEGLAGEVFASGKPMVASGLAEGFLRVSSATGHGSPQHVVAVPVLEEGAPAGVIELGFVGRTHDLGAAVELAGALGQSAGIALRSALYR